MPSILVIDDSTSMIAFLSSVLTTAGYEVVTANTGIEALEQFHKRSFDAVVTDLYMPEMDGIEMMKRMFAERHDTRLIAISSTDSPVNLLAAARFLGALGTLQKPFTAEKLLQAMSEILQQPIQATPPLSSSAEHAACAGRGDRQSASNKSFL